MTPRTGWTRPRWKAHSATRVYMVRGAVQKDWNVHWLPSNGRHLGELARTPTSRSGIGTDYKSTCPTTTRTCVVVSLTPVFRYERDDKRGLYGEGGIGASLFSELYRNDDNRLSTAFQFGDHLGIGYVLDNNWDLAAKSSITRTAASSIRTAASTGSS